MIELTGFIKKVASTVSKDGDVIIEITIAHNLTKSGVLSTAGELVAIQDQSVECSIKTQQGALAFQRGRDKEGFTNAG